MLFNFPQYLEDILPLLPLLLGAHVLIVMGSLQIYIDDDNDDDDATP